ncbi:hypothetical protein [Legionella sp. CNM-4043-24]|uniref:hypothetical protein n=1 Tax=Legionella sp. CNM-4043-24 TaxID=3421646 RepID=UPI00403B1B03
MPVSENILNEFYQGLKLLIEFETGQTRGAMSSPFFAVNKVVAHFCAALDKGDVIAPFFLHYVADTFPGYVDSLQLPDLSRVPEHKSKARTLVRNYQTFLSLYASVSKVQMSPMSSQKTILQLYDMALALMQSESTLGGVLAVQIIQQLCKGKFSAELNKLCAETLEACAFYPDVYAMYEYVRFLDNNGMRASSSEKHAILEEELHLLAESNGDPGVLMARYKKDKNSRYFSQWLFQSAIHGQIDLAILMLERYIFEDGAQWYDKITDRDRLAEAVKWFDWYEKHAPQKDLHAYWRQIGSYVTHYHSVIGGNKYKAFFLCYALDRMNLGLHEQSDILPQAVFLNQFADLAEPLQKTGEILSITWKLNNGRLPPESSTMMINEMARVLEARRDYHQAERLYRQVYTREPHHPVHQFNLANILALQNKKQAQQIRLFFEASQQRCADSIQYLYKILVIKGQGTVEDLERLKQLFESPDFDAKLPVPKKLLINLIVMTIFQRITNTDIIKWSKTLRDGKQLFTATYFVEQDSDETSLVDASDVSSTAIAACSTETHSDPVEEPVSTSSFRLFKPVKKEAATIDAAKARALRKLTDLNSKPVRNLSLKDFIQAKKAYQILTGDSGGIEISSKGRTSGSRAKIGDASMHLAHGRDRMSIGAQSEIKEKISELCVKFH